MQAFPSSSPTRDPLLVRAHERVERCRETSSRPGRGLVARVVIAMVDLVFGRDGSFPKFRALELSARVMYQVWESAAYHAITRSYPDPAKGHELAEDVERSRRQQDNEQRHLFWMEALCAARGERTRWLRDRVFPRALAMFLQRLAKLANLVRPRWTHRLNAELEDQAEREYLRFVADHPELEGERSPIDGFVSVADLLRSIALDEREHKEESLAACAPVEGDHLHRE